MDWLLLVKDSIGFFERLLLNYVPNRCWVSVLVPVYYFDSFVRCKTSDWEALDVSFALGPASSAECTLRCYSFEILDLSLEIVTISIGEDSGTCCVSWDAGIEA
jgi:hypothetical protein